VTYSNPESLLNELDRLERVQESSKQTKSQRQFRRFTIRGDAELHPINHSTLDATPIEVKLRNVGRGGIGFLCAQPVPIGSTWRMVLTNQGYKIGEQAVIVRFMRPVENNVYLFGGQFVIDTGLMIMLGVDIRSIMDDVENGSDQEDPSIGFIPPGEVA